MGTITRTGKTITGITLAKPPVATCVGHGLVTGQSIIIMGATFGDQVDVDSWTVPLDGQTSTITVIDANTFSIDLFDLSTYFWGYSFGGEIVLDQPNAPVQLTTLDKVKLELNMTGDAVTGITNANPAVVTCPKHGLNQNDEVAFSKVWGMTQINGLTGVVTPIDANTFSVNIDTSNTTKFSAYGGGGFVSTEDVYLAGQIVDQSAWFNLQVGRKILSPQEYVEIRNGDGGRSMDPFFIPIGSVVSVSIDNMSVPRRPAPGDPGWTYNNDRIWLDDYAIGNPFPGDYAPYYVDGSRWRFTRGSGNVVLRYFGGQPTPPDVDRAVCELIAYRYRNRDHIGLRSRSIPGSGGGELVTYMVDDCPPSVKAVIERYFQPSMS